MDLVALVAPKSPGLEAPTFRRRRSHAAHPRVFRFSIHRSKPICPQLERFTHGDDICVVNIRIHRLMIRVDYKFNREINGRASISLGGLASRASPRRGVQFLRSTICHDSSNHVKYVKCTTILTTMKNTYKFICKKHAYHAYPQTSNDQLLSL